MHNSDPRHYRDISAYPDSWSIAQGMLDGKPMFIRFRDGLREAIGHPGYAFQIGVAIPLLQPTQDGLTTDSEAAELHRIEQLLEQALTVNKKAVFALTITHSGMREFVFYASEWTPQAFEQRVRSIDAGPHELQFIMQHDPQWETFTRFVK